jgi:hypothetical protein
MKSKEGKTLVEHRTTRKWASAKKGSMNEFPWCVCAHQKMDDE